MLVRLKKQFNSIGITRRYHREPAMVSHWNVGLLRKAKNVRVEAQRFFLVVNQDTRDNDFHSLPPLRLGFSQRLTMAFNGVVSM
jgi:hypothetical protein